VLTADLVNVRRRGDRLHVVDLSDAERGRALDLAQAIINLVRTHVGLPRGTLLEALGQLTGAPSEQRLASALCKLALDACEFDEGTTVDPVELRQEIFSAAALARSHGQGDFDRARVLGGIAAARRLSSEEIEEALYADLPSAHLLKQAHLPSPEGLLARYQLGSRQAILLRAVRVHVRVRGGGSGAYRALFRALKFRRLLFNVGKLDRGEGFSIDIDGPFSVFEQTTKYGLQLALALPAIMACGHWDLVADVRWGKDRRPATFHLRGGAETDSAAAAEELLPDEVAALVEAVERGDYEWSAQPCDEILELPGIGVCVPDLVFVHRNSGERVYFEALGFWSRAAVWKRVELAEAGLPYPVVFAASKHLRVSEELIPENASAALYVYARMMNAREVVERVRRVAGGGGRGK
jgi:predicted nuclease of restriction endonuclease-like RecB superfamily